MGTSGNRKGYKIFSINTTVRNPKRNYDFLYAFQKFDNNIMNDNNLYLYFFELVKNGIYKFTNISESVKNKIENDIPLTNEEVKNAIENNPQATGLSGRVMTQLRSLKDQGLLIFRDSDQSGKYLMSISSLGKELLNNPTNATNIYTKIMLGIHANSPCRVKLLNESCPFLNTLFVINEVNKMWKAMGNEPKGILEHEFAAFVLSMKDCNYLDAANKIIEYRKKYRFRVDKKYLLNYLNELEILPLKWETIMDDYVDDVFRKFEMTGLIIKHGAFDYQYINFSNYNREKINIILETYKNYGFRKFETAEEYYAYQSNIILPWETNDIIRRKVIEAKAKVLNLSINSVLTVEEQEEMLDRYFYNQSLSKAISRYDDQLIFKELLILSGTLRIKSKFEDIPEPLRLEYLLALCLGKKYGTNGLVSNIIYNEEGLPLHCAPASKCDIIYHHIDGSYIIEPTMQRGRSQQLNSETTNIVRHVTEEEKKTNLKYRVMMVAPLVHVDVADYFRYKAISENAKITALSIEKTAGLLFDSNTVSILNENFDEIINIFKTKPTNDFVDLVNEYKFNLEKISAAV